MRVLSGVVTVVLKTLVKVIIRPRKDYFTSIQYWLLSIPIGREMQGTSKSNLCMKSDVVYLHSVFIGV